MISSGIGKINNAKESEINLTIIHILFTCLLHFSGLTEWLFTRPPRTTSRTEKLLPIFLLIYYLEQSLLLRLLCPTQLNYFTNAATENAGVWKSW